MSDAIDIDDNPDQSRFEISVGGRVAGFTEYRTDERRTNTTVFRRTEIDPEYRESDLADRLAEYVLDLAGSDGRSIAPVCPVIKSFIQRHPQYRPLIDEAYRENIRAS